MRTFKRAEPELPTATAVEFDNQYMYVHLADGRTLTVPLDVTARLLRATEEQRRNWRFIGPGIGIHWEEIDADLSVAGLVRDYGRQTVGS